MSIKQSIAALLVLMSVSFNASAIWWEVNSSSSEECVMPGTAFTNWDDVVALSSCFNGKTVYKKPYVLYNCRGSQQTGYESLLNCSYNYSGTKTYAAVRLTNKYSEPPKSRCEKLMETEPTLGVWWNEQAYGRDMLGNFWCGAASNCTAQLTTFVGCDSGNCFADAHYTGDECEHGTLSGFCSDITCSAQLPEPEQPDPDNPDPDNPDPDNPDPDNPDPDNPDPDNPDVTDPTHDPDDPTGGDIEDPSVLPDDSTNTVDPGTTEDEPDVEDPPTDESTDTAVVSAITGMNKDVNKALNVMNIDINQASADVQNQIIALNASVITNTQAIQKQQANDNEIYRKTKSLIQQANADITTAVNKNTNAINGVGNDVEQMAGAMDGIAEDVAGISETLDGIANTDTSGAGTGGTCIDAGNCTGFYESAYPDGLGGLVSGQLNDLKTNVIDDFVNSFGN
ncbi:hypothetical protein ACUT7I_003330, partial [Vibrio cholerae]